MLPEPLPDRGPDDEPDGSTLSGEEWDGPEQGLFVCLPPEELTLAGFAQNGRADTMEPGPLLATVVEAVTGDDAKGLAGLSDDQLTGIISAAQRLESRVAWIPHPPPLPSSLRWPSSLPAAPPAEIKASAPPAPRRPAQTGSVCMPPMRSPETCT